MSSVEPEVKQFLQKIVVTIFLGLIWMLINTLAGIKWGYAFFEDGLELGNIIFYIWLVGSLTALLWYYWKIWKKDILS